MYFCSKMTELNQKEIGLRLAGLRKAKNYSQEELAALVGITRPSLAQLEMGNRGLSALELLAFAEHLHFSLDAFMSKNFSVGSSKITAETDKENPPTEERISVPKLNIAKFKQILLYILEKCAGKPNVGETVLYKLLYFCEFNYYELFEEHLAGTTFKKLPFGPVPQKIDRILAGMEEKGELKLVKVPYFNKTQKRYLPLVKADLSYLKANEVEVIDQVLEQLSHQSASMLSDYSHGDKPWKATEDNKEINYELVFYRRPPYSVRVYNDDEQN